MKKNLIIILSICTLMLLTSCTSKSNSNSNELTNNENSNKSTEEKNEDFSLDLIKDLYSLCESNDNEVLFKIMSSNKFNRNLEYIKSEPLIYSPESSGSVINGVGIGIYEGGYIYFGNYQNNERFGIGKWFYVVDGEYNYSFNGKWENDKPNGNGEINQTWLNPSEGELTQKIISGNLTDGLWDGEITIKNISNNVSTEFNSNYTKGFISVLETLEIAATEEKKNVVGNFKNQSGESFNVVLTDINYELGIDGFYNKSSQEESFEYIKVEVKGINLLDLYLKDLNNAEKILGDNYTIEEDIDMGEMYMQYDDISLVFSDSNIIYTIILSRDMQSDLSKYSVLGANFEMNNEEIYNVCGEPYYGDRYSFTYKTEHEYNWIKFDFDQDGNLQYLLLFAAPDNTLGAGFSW